MNKKEKLIIVSDGKSPLSIVDGYIDKYLFDRYDVTFCIVKSIIRKILMHYESIPERNIQVLNFIELRTFRNYIYENKGNIRCLLHFGPGVEKAFPVFTLYNEFKLRWGHIDLSAPRIRYDSIIISSAFSVVLKIFKRLSFELSHRAQISPTIVATVGLDAEVYNSEYGRIKSQPLINHNVLKLYERQINNDEFEIPPPPIRFSIFTRTL